MLIRTSNKTSSVNVARLLENSIHPELYPFPAARETLVSASLLLALFDLLAQAAASVFIQLLRPETGMRQIEADVG